MNDLSGILVKGRFTNVRGCERLPMVPLQLNDLSGIVVKGRFTNVRGCERLCMVPLQLIDLSALLVKDCFPCYGVLLSRRDMTLEAGGSCVNAKKKRTRVLHCLLNHQSSCRWILYYSNWASAVSFREITSCVARK